MADDPALALAVPLIAEFEGFSPTPYKDSGGTWTIGYGFTYLPGGPVTMHTAPMTQAECLAYLSQLVAHTMQMVREMVYVPITDAQCAGLTSMGYNVGTGALRNSTLLKLLNEGDYTGAGHAFSAWVYVKGRISSDLVGRRAKEAAPFLPARTVPPPEPVLTADDLNQQVLDGKLS